MPTLSQLDLVASVCSENFACACGGAVGGGAVVAQSVSGQDGLCEHHDDLAFAFVVNWQPREACGLIPSLDPYTVVWQYITPDGQHNSETASLYGINTTIADAIKVVMQKINKARANIKDSRINFDNPELLNCLRRGRDQFNAMGQTTSFTMTNAKFGQREYWIMLSEVEALRAHYLFEGETDFDYAGQAISLSVNRAQYYDTLADKIEGVINERVKPYKDLLSKRGNISGDGSVDPNRLDKRAIGNIGISITPVSKITSYRYLGVNFLLQRPLF